MLTINIKKTFPGKSINFDAEWPADGSWTTLFGPSGAGKSTVLRCLAGLERPDSGIISFKGERWNDGKLFVSPQARNVGLFFQDYALFPHLSVAKNIAYGISELPQSEIKTRVGEMVEIFGLAGLENRNVKTLSGGEKQKTALARTLCRRPRLLLLDEPFSALDAPSQLKFRRELKKVMEPFKIPILLVTHSRAEALTLSDRVVVIAEGQILQLGPIEEVFSRPASQRVAEIVGMENIFPGRIIAESEGLVTIQTNKGELTALSQGLESGPAWVGIRAEDIAISTHMPRDTSARNHMEGKLVSILPEDCMARVTIDCGYSLDALITRKSVEEMGLKANASVYLSVKTPSIHLFPHSTTNQKAP